MSKNIDLQQKIIRSHSQILAIIFKKSLKAKGVNFLTPESYSLQLGLLEHPAGKIIKDHKYNPKIKYRISSAQEFLYVEKGIIQADIFDDDWKLVSREILSAGDFLLHVSGGQGFKVLKACRMIEIKQGPYPGESRAKIYKNDTGK